MGNKAILIFVCDLVKSWHRKRADGLARLVLALMDGGRLGVAAIGRHIATPTTDKHHIKAVDRFLGNRAIDLLLLWAALIRLVSGGRKRLYVLLDWTDLNDGIHEMLAATVSFGGRSVPIAWSTWVKGQYYKSRNRVETGFAVMLRGLLPPDLELAIIADRAFGRASFVRALKRANIHFVIRIRKDIHLIDEKGHGPVKNRSIQRGRTRDLPSARFGDNARVGVRCVITFGQGLMRKRPAQPWYLITDLSSDDLPAIDIVAAYKLRMRVEHNFRDHKSMRFGFQLRSVKLSTVGRYDNLFAVAAIALLLLTLIGARVESLGLHRQFKANTDPGRTHSLFHLGLAFLHRLKYSFTPDYLLQFCLLIEFEGMG
jgi:hypothetical protein